MENITSRKEAEENLTNALSDRSTVQFLLKNLYWKDANHLGWRFGISEIEKNIEEMGKALPPDKKINTKTLFLRGERSGYINTSDEQEIKKIFTNVRIETISNAGHWVHAENPKEFLDRCLIFLVG